MGNSKQDAHPCSERFRRAVNQMNIGRSCRHKTLGAELGWNFDAKTRQLDIAFGSRLDSRTGWLAWGLNPYGRRMVGTRALIGIKHDNGSLGYHMYNITEETKRGCPLLPSDDDMGRDLGVRNFDFSYVVEVEYFVIRATIILPDEYKSRRTNVVWQIGAAVDETGPLMHRKSLKNFHSVETIDFDTDKVVSPSEHGHRLLVTIHGILNIVGWGTLLPVGVIVARYFRTFPQQLKMWFGFHVGCQSAGYIVGSAGWSIGLWLGKASVNYSFHVHRILGILIFTFTTIQMLALRLRPSKRDEYRTYWNVYHACMGYSMLALISVNIFVGIMILDSHQVWKWAYIGVLGTWGAVAGSLELFTWTKFIFLDKKSVR